DVERQALDLQPLRHVVLAQPAGRDRVLNHGESERGALADEERRGLGPGESARLRHDPLENGGKLAVATDRDAQLQQLLEHLRAPLRGGRAENLEEAADSRTR